VGDVQLLWDDRSTTEDSFRVERSPNDNLSYAEIANLPAGTQDYLDTGLADGDYFYRTRSALGAEFSSYSNAVSVTVSGAAGPAVIIEDDFTGPQALSIDGRTPDTVDNGNTWITSRSAGFTPGISGSGTANQQQSFSYNGTTIDSGASDCVITTAYAVLPEADHAIATFRNTSTGSASSWAIRYRTGPGTFNIYENTTLRATLTVSLAINTPLTVTLNGTH
jgi:hypothetical protein